MGYLELVGTAYSFVKALLAVVLVVSMTACGTLTLKEPEPGHRVVYTIEHQEVRDRK